MKYKFLFFPCLFLCQCTPQSNDEKNYEKFITLKEEKGKKSKIISCSVKPVDDDIDLSHYEVYGFSCRGEVGCGILKIAHEKNGQRLNYKIPLSPDEGVKLDKIYMSDTEKEKFSAGKTCKFRILFDEQENGPQFIIKDGVLERRNENGESDGEKNEKINISIFIEHKKEGKVHKASDEIVLY